ncbi:2OG-Fe(II) oxygenase [Burkholderia sp. FERM BP-3421]|jgi:hypothetical protein|uniref:2OG-Fe(II) oxygenase n=1 Tax=Burkholderia sp. FERM BP-3421 TaxID=1494466 RepID=UPI002361A81B|nr:2OG-Fe(II) oxygenase [Burkholderia sp. FERM BP-3421]WDD92629.1 2OG-Fe(II) oxygenase [Burkholderia sp. FERM BP-3421]
MSVARSAGARTVISVPDEAEPPYRFEELDAADLAGTRPNGLADISEGRVDGLIIHNAFSREEIERVSSRLTRREPLPDSPFGKVLIYGPALYIAESDLERYRREAAEFRVFCAQLFEGGRDFSSRIAELLGAMTGGRGLRVPNAPDGEPYTHATVRVLEVGQGIGWHFENQFLHATRGYRHLSTLVSHTDHLGFFIVLEAPRAGGELMLYGMRWEETEWLDKERGGIAHTGTIRGRPITDVMENYPRMSVTPPPGSLLVFNGGTILHRVVPVAEGGRRVTIGGFIAFSKGRQDVYYWS